MKHLLKLLVELGPDALVRLLLLSVAVPYGLSLSLVTAMSHVRRKFAERLGAT